MIKDPGNHNTRVIAEWIVGKTNRGITEVYAVDKTPAEVGADCATGESVR